VWHAACTRGHRGRLTFVWHVACTALQAGGHKVLIFSQMTRCLDLLEDYLHMAGYGPSMGPLQENLSRFDIGYWARGVYMPSTWPGMVRAWVRWLSLVAATRVCEENLFRFDMSYLGTFPPHGRVRAVMVRSMVRFHAAVTCF
jgi:hypothetical protein